MLVVAVSAGCGHERQVGGIGSTTVATGATTSATLIQTQNHDQRGCLDPRHPETEPAAGWLPDTAPSDFEIGTGSTARTTSPAGAALAARFEAATSHGFAQPSVFEVLSPCVVERSVQLRRSDGNTTFLQVLQLRAPISVGSFPIGGEPFRRQLGDGSLLVTADFDRDASRVSAIVVRPDGLLVRVSAASPNSANISGWPTTFLTPSTAPHTPAALTLDDVARLAQDMIAAAAP